MKIGIIIVNYDKKDLLERCLVSLGDIAHNDYEVVVVDNGSLDGSQSLVTNKFPYVRLVEMGYNSGFCKANNVGIDLCLSHGCEAVVLLNNDTEVMSNFLAEMDRVVDKEEKVGMVAAKILFMDRKDIVDSVGLEITPDGYAKNRGFEMDEKGFDMIKEVFCPAGAAALYTKELLEDVKRDGQYLDENFGFYFEELDLGWRARLAGWKCVCNPAAIVYHIKSATSGAYSEFVAFHTNRNIYYNIIKNYPGLFLWKALVLSVFRYPLLLLGGFAGKGPAAKIGNRIGLFKTMKVTFRSIGCAFLNLTDIFGKRRYIQKKKIVSNKDVRLWFKKFGLSFRDSLYR